MIDPEQAAKIIAEMRARQEEVFEAIAARKGALYAKCLQDASDAMAIAQYAITCEVPQAQKELNYLCRAVSLLGMSTYADRTNTYVTREFADAFVSDMHTCVKMMLHYEVVK